MRLSTQSYLMSAVCVAAAAVLSARAVVWRDPWLIGCACVLAVAAGVLATDGARWSKVER